MVSDHILNPVPDWEIPVHVKNVTLTRDTNMSLEKIRSSEKIVLYF